METMKTVRLGNSTLTVTKETYARLIRENKAVATQDAFEHRNFTEYERLKRELGE